MASNSSCVFICCGYVPPDKVMTDMHLSSQMPYFVLSYDLVYFNVQTFNNNYLNSPGLCTPFFIAFIMASWRMLLHQIWRKRSHKLIIQHTVFFIILYMYWGAHTVAMIVCIKKQQNTLIKISQCIQIGFDNIWGHIYA